MAKGDKIYVVTAGEYSDYHICAVTTDRERAEFLRKWYFGDYTEIEEYIDGCPDAPVTTDLIPRWFVTCTEDGAIDTCEIDRYYTADSVLENEFSFIDSCYDNSVRFCGHVTTKDKEQAIKIVKDMRAKKLAERFGT